MLTLSAALVAGAAIAFIAFRAPGPSGPGWNVLLISVDTLRADHLGVYGYDRPTSPNIDRLAGGGIVFTQAFCQNTNTNPSHASILSGLYPRAHGNWDNYFLMADDITMAPEVFQKTGYTTAAFVSGYTLKKKICGLDQGFDLYEDSFSSRERRGDRTTDLALDWMRAHAGEPFFLFVHLFDPHGRYAAPESKVREFPPRQPPEPAPVERIPKYQRLPVGVPPEEIWTDLQRYKARYDTEIAFSDLQVGRLLAALDELELAGKTVVIFTSDHGEVLDERFHLLDHGGNVGDEEIRIPLIIRSPDGRLAGHRYDGQVESIDIMPTLVELLGLDYPSPMQGADLLPIVAAQADSPHPYSLTETRVIPFRWRHRPYQLSRRDTLKSIRNAGAKLVAFPGEGRNYYELYDLVADPEEQDDIFAEGSDLAEPLMRELQRVLDTPPRHNTIADPATDDETRKIFQTLGYVD